MAPSLTKACRRRLTASAALPLPAAVAVGRLGALPNSRDEQRRVHGESEDDKGHNSGAAGAGQTFRLTRKGCRGIPLVGYCALYKGRAREAGNNRSRSAMRGHDKFLWDSRHFPALGPQKTSANP
jgi:hypothetical protein